MRGKAIILLRRAVDLGEAFRAIINLWSKVMIEAVRLARTGNSPSTGGGCSTCLPRNTSTDSVD